MNYYKGNLVEIIGRQGTKRIIKILKDLRAVKDPYDLTGCVFTCDYDEIATKYFDIGIPMDSVTADALSVKFIAAFPGLKEELKVLDAIKKDMYKLRIGDTVINKSTRKFTGVIVAFEQDTGLVICRSALIGNYRDDKVRYAYPLSSLERYAPEPKPTEFEFILGKGYTWNNYKGHPCLATEYPHDLDKIQLVTGFGKVAAVVPKKCSIKKLRELRYRNIVDHGRNTSC